MKTKKNLTNIIKSNINEILSCKNNDNDIKVRLNYIIERITDSEYYIKLINKEKRDYKNKINEKEKSINNNDNHTIHSITTMEKSLSSINKVNNSIDLKNLNKNVNEEKIQVEINKINAIQNSNQNIINNQNKSCLEFISNS